LNRIANGILVRIFRTLRRIAVIHPFVSRAFQEWYELPFPPTHYHSPLPEIPTVKRNLHRWYREDGLAGIRMDLRRQTAFLDSLAMFGSECDKLPSFDRVTAEGYGPGYGEVEAHFLHCLIRHFKPRKIIEVGSGVSTYFALNALEMNRHNEGIDASMICVEPYPKPKLHALVAQQNVTAYEQQVQDVDTRLFEQLEEGDMLFVDSSHVTKVDSDVNFLYFGVLPTLRKGVIVHVHDIAFPYLTCPPDHPMFDQSLLWNEGALLRAFLMWNGVFEILMCQSFLHFKCPESIKKVLTIYDQQKHFPSSIWMVKVG